MNDFTPEQVRELAEFMTQAQLIEYFKPSSRGFFVRFLKKHSIIPKNTTFSPPIDEIRRLSETMCNSDLAKYFGVSRMTMNRFCEKHGIETAKYIQTDDTIRKRSSSLKEASKKDVSLNFRKTRGLMEHNAGITGKTIEEIYGDDKGKEYRERISKKLSGSRHSIETREKRGASIRKWHAENKVSDDTREKISKSRKLGFLNGSIRLSPQAGFGKGGFRDDIGHYVRSTYEHTFALLLLKNNVKYEYEPETFYMEINGGCTSYTPDFRIAGVFFEIKNEFNARDENFLAKLAYMENILDIHVHVLIGPSFEIDDVLVKLNVKG